MEINHKLITIKQNLNGFANERQMGSQITIALGVALKHICSPNEM